MYILTTRIEHTVGNVVRRILRLIREEWSAAAGRGSPSSTRPITPELQPKPAPELGPISTRSSRSLLPPTIPPRLTTLQNRSSQYSLSGFVLHGRPHREESAVLSPQQEPSKPQTALQLPETGAKSKAQSIKPALIDAIQEVVDELETVYENVAKNSRDHIHSEWVALPGPRSILTKFTSEIILTIGMSKTVEAFLKQANSDRKFTAIVAETGPRQVTARTTKEVF